MEEKPHRVLCLHGWRTNPSVMQFQAQDLSRRLSEACSMHFMAARVEQSEACDPMIGASFPAPYYEHWGLHKDDEEAMNEDICATVRYTADFVARNGPFHAIVGFSQGAGLASLLVALQQRLRLLPLPVLVCICGVRPAHRRQVPSSATCLVRRLLGPDPLLDADRSDAEAPDVAQIDCESIHIVGLQDPMVAKSRALSQAYSEHTRKVYEHAGGHSFPPLGRSDALYEEVANQIRTRLKAAPADAVLQLPPDFHGLQLPSQLASGAST